ncbi:unnamed protein product [Nezara viridula]|uniref:Uncharacterized protein n=1 Tax=Nezara viridula TaxID=85310 RepID=A0A9P0MRL7_NEZVI|nr:unnamed protein product [Nezara viridula]
MTRDPNSTAIIGSALPSKPTPAKSHLVQGPLNQSPNTAADNKKTRTRSRRRLTEKVQLREKLTSTPPEPQKAVRLHCGLTSRLWPLEKFQRSIDHAPGLLVLLLSGG